MGAYVNPPGQDKRDWLIDRIRSGDAITIGNAGKAPARFDSKRGWLPIVMVSNGNFAALGILWCQEELERARHVGTGRGGDDRPTAWFWTRDDEELLRVSDLAEHRRLAAAERDESLR